MTVRYTLPLTDGDDRELVGARLWVLGAVGLQELPGALVAWFDQRDDDVPPGGTWTVEPARDWLQTWRAGIEPVAAGRIVVVPTWLAATHEAAPGQVVLVLDPGGAFGSGHHATTQLCLEVLDDVLEPGASVVDVGCGTGVLSIAAALLGAGSVVAVDLDPDAVRTTTANAAANGTTEIVALVGSVETAGHGDIVLANLLTPTLHALADELIAAVRPGGVLIASGVATERAASVVADLRAAGGGQVERRDRDGWSALVVHVPEVAQ